MSAISVEFVFFINSQSAPELRSCGCRLFRAVLSRHRPALLLYARERTQAWLSSVDTRRASLRMETKH